MKEKINYFFAALDFFLSKDYTETEALWFAVSNYRHNFHNGPEPMGVINLITPSPLRRSCLPESK